MISMLGASAAAGGFAGLLGVPAGTYLLERVKSVADPYGAVEVVLIRMASDRTRPLAERYGYRNCIHGLYRITKDEGILALYRGVGPNVVCSDCISPFQLG